MKKKRIKTDGRTTPTTISNDAHSLVTPPPKRVNWDLFKEDDVSSDEPNNSGLHSPPKKEVESNDENQILLYK